MKQDVVLLKVARCIGAPSGGSHSDAALGFQLLNTSVALLLNIGALLFKSCGYVRCVNVLFPSWENRYNSPPSVTGCENTEVESNGQKWRRSDILLRNRYFGSK